MKFTKKDRIEAEFIIEGNDETYKGFHYDQYWNGWACPYFTKEVRDKWIADEKKIFLDKPDATFRKEDMEFIEGYEGIEPDEEGIYSFGYSLCWRIADDKYKKSILSDLLHDGWTTAGNLIPKWIAKLATENKNDLVNKKVTFLSPLNLMIDRTELNVENLSGAISSIEYQNDDLPLIWIKLDKKYPILDEWKNCIVLEPYGNDDDEGKVSSAIVDILTQSETITTLWDMKLKEGDRVKFIDDVVAYFDRWTPLKLKGLKGTVTIVDDATIEDGKRMESRGRMQDLLLWIKLDKYNEILDDWNNEVSLSCADGDHFEPLIKDVWENNQKILKIIS